MAFIKGQSGNPKGKPKGAQNKITKTVKNCIQEAFDELQLDPKVSLIAWARKNPSEFYKLCSKLIPVAVDAKTETERVIQVFKIGKTEIEL
jgi:hypothetical protein